MDPALRQRTISGIVWSAISRAAVELFQLTFAIILARLLSPRDFGLVGMVMIFTGFAGLFTDFGFSSALIQRAQLRAEHPSSVFWVNVLAGSLLALLAVAAGPLVASFYGEASLGSLTALVGISFFITSLGLVHRAMLTRELLFRKLALIDIAIAVVPSAFAVTLASMGAGPYALAWHCVAQAAVGSALLWTTTSWRPAIRFDRKAVQELLGFSGHLFGFQALNYWLRNGDDLLVAKFLGSTALGVYSRAYSFMLLPLQKIVGVVAPVMLPAFSRLQSDHAQVKLVYLQLVGTVAFLCFPMMVGLYVVADSFVLVLLGSQWVDVISVLRILCAVGLVQSIGTTTGLIYESQGRTDLMFRWGIGAGSLILLAFAVGVHWGITGAAIAYTFVNYVLLYPQFVIPGALIGLRFREVLRAVWTSLACATAMGLAVWALGNALPSLPPLLRLVAQVMFGMLTYGAMAHFFALEQYRSLRSTVAEQWRLYWSLTTEAHATAMVRSAREGG